MSKLTYGNIVDLVYKVMQRIDIEKSIDTLHDWLESRDPRRPTPHALDGAYWCPKCGDFLGEGGWCPQHGLPASPRK